jgi:site-specific recombinase, phage integrase family
MEKMDLEIDDFMNYCEYRNLSKKTLLSYEQTLRLFSRYLIDTYKINRSEQVTQQIILNYINDTKERGKYTVVANENTKKTNNPQNRGDYGKKVSIVTLNNYIRNLKVYFNYMYENRIIKKNPTQKIKLIHVPRKAKGYMNDIEVNNLLKCFDLSRFHEYRDCVITELLFDTGMRLGECLLIKEKTDINFAERTIFLPADNTKGKKDRYVFFSVQMATELKRWLQYKDRYKESEYVFCTIKGTVLQERSFESNFSNYGERIGKKEINPHLLRNNFAKRFLMNGGDIFTLSKILGHSSIKVTEQCYLDLQTEDLKKQYEKHSPLMNLKKGNKAVASN